MAIKRVKPPKVGFNPHQGSLELIPHAHSPGQPYDPCRPVEPIVNQSSKTSPAPAMSEPMLKKVTFLMDQFSCRTDVYAEFWETATKKGYAPKCSNYGSPGICSKVFDWKFDCKTCPHRQFAPLTLEVLHRHLTKAPHIGIYPLLPDHTCRLVVIDFDRKEWMTDEAWKAEVIELMTSCNNHRVPCAAELSRGGDGVHVWIFFSEFVPALLARKLALGLQTDAANRIGLIKLNCYDRLIPNQDFLATGGCGTVIALPYQFLAMKQGRSIFIDPFDGFKPIQHHLDYLRDLPKLSCDELKLKISEVIPEGAHELGVPYMLDVEPHRFWRKGSGKPAAIADLPKEVTIELGAGVSFDLREMPAQLAVQLSRLAAFPNPAFYIKQNQGFSTYGVPIVERRMEVEGNRLKLPRGCLDPVYDLLKSYGVSWNIVDRRSPGTPIEVTFTGTLWDDQAEALEAMLQHDVGTLKAAPAFGKTVLGAALIARRKVSTLIVVNRKNLARQWRIRLPRFLNISPDQIGVLGGPKSKPTGIVDIVMMPTLGKMKDVEALTDGYGQVIIDECHRSAAKSVEGNLNKIGARYFEGLSATPKRSDGRQPLVFMACGNVRFVSKRPTGAPEDLTVKPRFRATPIPLPATATWNQVCDQLVADADRTRFLIQEGLEAYAKGRHVLLLTGRKAHAKALADGFVGKVEHLFSIESGSRLKDRELVMAQIEALPPSVPRVVVSTWQLVGEGFDHAPLNTLILCLPFSWEGTVTQCAGRLDRYLPEKLDAEIIDIIDQSHPICMKMWQARVSAYRLIKYRVIDDKESLDLF